VSEEPEDKNARNVYQRKLAVMKRCDEIVPDKVHPHHKFEYNSIQQISNRLRQYAVEEGLDIAVDFPPEHEGYARVTLTCSEMEGVGGVYTSRSVHFYPIAPDDKGLAYSTKYPLIRLFLIGDGEENDEAEMANKSSARPSRKPAPKSGLEDLGPCVICAGEGWLTSKGNEPRIYKRAGKAAQCNGIRGEAPDGTPEYANHTMDPPF